MAAIDEPTPTTGIRPEGDSRRLPPVFVSHVPADRAAVARLRTHLLARAWHRFIDQTRDIEPGGDWTDRIADAVAQSKVFILCLSADYLASSYIRDTELPAIAARRRQGALVVPVVIRPCAWETIVSGLQAVPTSGYKLLPITEWRPVEKGYDVAAAQIVSGVDAHFGIRAEADSPFRSPGHGRTFGFAEGPPRLTPESIRDAVASVRARAARSGS